MNTQTEGTAENLLLQHFKSWAIEYVKQTRNGTFIVKMNTPRNTIAARQILNENGYEVSQHPFGPHNY